MIVLAATMSILGLIVLSQVARRPLSQAASTTTSRTATSQASRPASNPDGRRVHVFVSGRVQGVGFRFFTETAARNLGLTGWVRNLSDGRVEAVIEGPSDKVAALLDQMRKGPQ